MDKGGSNQGAAAEFYNSGKSGSGNNSDFLNAGPGAGASKDRLSQVSEEDDYGLSKHGYFPSLSYGSGGYAAGDPDKTKPLDDTQDASLVRNAAVPGRSGLHDLGVCSFL